MIRKLRESHHAVGISPATNSSHRRYSIQALSWPYQHGRYGGWSEAMKRPMFAIETDPVEGLSIVVTRPMERESSSVAANPAAHFRRLIHVARNSRAS